MIFICILCVIQGLVKAFCRGQRQFGLGASGPLILDVLTLALNDEDGP